MTASDQQSPQTRVAVIDARRNRRAGRLDPRLLLGGAIVSATVFIAIAAPWISPHDPYAGVLSDTLLAPLSPGHLLGTDELGRDVLSRVLYGAAPVIQVAGSATILALLLGTSLGVVAATSPRWVDQVVGRLADIQLSIPGIILALLVLSLFKASLSNLIIVLALEAWPFYYRVARTQTMNLNAQGYVEASWIGGSGFARRTASHIVPGLLPVIVVTTTISFSGIVMTAAGLSFLGLGVQPPTPEWGLMISLGKSQLATAWWLSMAPAAALVVFLLGIQLLGDWLSDLFAVSGRGAVQ